MKPSCWSENLSAVNSGKQCQFELKQLQKREKHKGH